MNAVQVFTPADATIVVALIVAISAWIQQRRTGKSMGKINAQLQPNAGKTVRDAIDRIEALVKHEVIPRLDHGAAVQADHADRIAALEHKPRKTRSAA